MAAFVSTQKRTQSWRSTEDDEEEEEEDETMYSNSAVTAGAASQSLRLKPTEGAGRLGRGGEGAMSPSAVEVEVVMGGAFVVVAAVMSVR